MMNFPDVVSKLGLVDHPKDQPLFRRISPSQLKASGVKDPLVYLKQQAVLLFQKALPGIEVNLDNFEVFLTYKDIDGDMTIIHTLDDLIAALEEYTDAGKIKILAQVEEKPQVPPGGTTADSTANLAECSDSDDSSSGSDDDNPLRITVQGAGLAAVNGVYYRDGYYEEIYKFTKPGKWNGSNAMYHIFQYQFPSTKEKLWYISAILSGNKPGLETDIDFYRAKVKDGCLRIPPKTGWTEDENGIGSSPTLVFG